MKDSEIVVVLSNKCDGNTHLTVPSTEISICEVASTFENSAMYNVFFFLQRFHGGLRLFLARIEAAKEGILAVDLQADIR